MNTVVNLQRLEIERAKHSEAKSISLMKGKTCLADVSDEEQGVIDEYLTLMR